MNQWYETIDAIYKSTRQSGLIAFVLIGGLIVGYTFVVKPIEHEVAQLKLTLREKEKVAAEMAYAADAMVALRRNDTGSDAVGNSTSVNKGELVSTLERFDRDALSIEEQTGGGIGLTFGQVTPATFWEWYRTSRKQIPFVVTKATITAIANDNGSPLLDVTMVVK